MTVNAYKKLHKKKLRSEVSANSSLIKYGMYALQAVVAGILKPIQVEAVRRVITRETQRVGKIFVRIRFNFPVTKKPLLSRMGKGTGPIKY
jgi:large subunit ribosomal protein L16